MRVGVFGGTFDPVHQGHLILAEQCREQAQLDQVWFVPAPRPPHKEEDFLTRFDQRMEMLSLALAGNPSFAIEDLEKDRDGPSYTVDTLAELHQRHPNDELFLLIGSDTLNDLHLWHQPLRLLSLAGLVVMPRPGNPVPTVDELRQRLQMPADQELKLVIVQTPIWDISSREIRRRIAAGRTIRYFVPRAVEVYIQEKKLYRG